MGREARAEGGVGAGGEAGGQVGERGSGVAGRKIMPRPERTPSQKRWHKASSVVCATSRLEHAAHRASHFVRLLSTMDTDGDGRISFAEWCYGVLVQPEICHFLHG